jgi:hypothetical protein
MVETNKTLKKFEIFYPGHDETVELGDKPIKLGKISRIVYNELDREIEVFYDEEKKKTVYNLDKAHYYTIWLVD